MGWLVFAIWLLLTYLFTRLCTGIAVRRGRSEQRWTFLALFFGPLALLAAILLPRKEHRA